MAKKIIKRKVATTHNPTIEAVVEELFYFQKRPQALERIESLRQNFIIAKEQEHDVDDSNAAISVRLWIKGYDLSPDEKSKGYLGNFAMIKIKEAKDGNLTLYAEKEEVPLTVHPQRKRPKRAHPDWGHPVMRSVKNKRLYDDIDTAFEDLQTLHKEYPSVSIPGKNKLFVILYEKRTDSPNPSRKYVLEVKNTEDGKFFIEGRENIRTTGPKKKEGATAPSKGFFTSMVQAKRGKHIDNANASN